MTRQAGYALVLMVEGLLLLATTYFFWFISSFPAPRAETGIETTEWVWLLALLVPLILVYSFWMITHRHLMSIGLFLLMVALMAALLPTLNPSFAVDRADWFWLLLLVLPIYGVRFLMFDRWHALSILFVIFACLLLLFVIAVEITPDVTGYPSRGWGMVMRPLLGMMWVLYLSDVALYHGRMDSALHLLVAFGILIGYYALSSTQWDLSKSEVFAGLIEQLNKLPMLAPFERLNPNEIAGVMVWLVPVMVSGALYTWQMGRWLWRGLSLLALVLLLMALLAGQSRSAILGLGVTGVFALIFFTPKGIWRWGLVGVVVALGVFQAALLFNVFEGDDGGGLSLRDQLTTTERFVFWESAFDMVKDYPLTGVGMNMYRDYAVRLDYPIDPERAKLTSPPHAHNEFVQIATDFGIPGFLLWTALYGVAAYELWISIRHGDRKARVVAVSVATGLLAHAIFGLTDAIPLWDRFSFVFWVMLGVLTGQALLVRQQNGMLNNLSETENTIY